MNNTKAKILKEKTKVSLGLGTQAQDLLRLYSIQKVNRSCKDEEEDLAMLSRLTKLGFLPKF